MLPCEVKAGSRAERRGQELDFHIQLQHTVPGRVPRAGARGHWRGAVTVRSAHLEAGAKCLCLEGDSTRGEKLLCEGMLFPACVVVWGWEAQEPFLHCFQVFKGTSIPARPGPAP